MADRDEAGTAGLGRAVADWRDEQHYLHLLELDRAGWAWEWLRRNPDYIEAEFGQSVSLSDESARSRPTILSGAPAGAASRWGLCFCRGAEPAR